MNKEVKLLVVGNVVFLVMMLAVCDFAKAGGSELSHIKTHQSDESVLKVKVDVSEPARIMRNTKGGEFIELGWPGASKSGEIGTPALPVVRKLFIVPFGAEVTVDVSSGRSSIIDLTDDEGVPQKIMPVQAPIEKRPGAIEKALFHFDMDAYNVASYLPAERVVVEELGIVRGQRLFLLEMRPVSYNPVAGKITFWPELSAELYFTGGEQRQDISVLPGLDKIVINPEILARGKNGSGNYLIIVASVFETAIGPFSTAKVDQGFTVTTYSASPGTSNTTIKSYLEGLWGTVDAPAYILLVGDTDTIPSWTGAGTGNPDTDLPYTCMDGVDDWYPDIALGRFPVRSTTQLNDVVEKTLAFENRQFADNDYVNRAVFMASEDNYTVTEGTHNWVIDNYMTPNEIISDKLYCHTYSATTQQVRDAFNDGRLYGVYSGHGSEYSWADGPPFTQSDIRNLINANMYPLVLSFACVTGSYTLQECFTETWLLVPDKGSVAVYGSSVTSYWTEDDQLEKDLFRVLFDDEIYEIGPCWNATRMRYLAAMGAGSFTRRYFEMYNLMGDPSVYIPVEYIRPHIFVDANAPGPTHDGWSWDTAYRYLQDALAVAESGDEIWVANGRYYPDANAANPTGTGDRTATFGLIDGVGIYGGFAGGETSLDERNWVTNKTILSGDIGTVGVNTDNSYHVVTSGGTDATAVLDGFTIRAGNANGSYPDNEGGGMYNYSYSSPTVTSCTFTGNSAQHCGGGMYNTSYSSPTLTNCTFSGNSAEYGGGMYNYGYSSATLTNCTITGNKAETGGGILSGTGSSVTLTNCTFAANSAINGNALACDAGNPPQPSNFKLSNCILWDGGEEIWNNGNWAITDLLEQGLVSHWKLDGNADDSVGGSHGTVYGNPVWTGGKLDGALALDGDGDYVDCGNDSSLDFTNNFSISAWFNVDNVGSVMLVCKGNVPAIESGGAYNILCSPSNGLLVYYVRDSNNANFGYAMIGVSLNKWTHVVVTFSDGNIGIYKNGLAQPGGSLGTSTIHSNDESLGIGAEGDGGMPFDGIIDDVRIYARVLSDLEIRQIANYIEITYSDVQEGGLGEGNIDAEPSFVSPGFWAHVNDPNIIVEPNDPNAVWVDGDYHLLVDSPCIDAGDNNSVPADTADLDGDANTTEPTPLDLDSRPRFADGDCNDTEVVDMGAYEFAWAYIGDFDGQCDVDFEDFAILALAWLSETGDAQWNPDCDISIPADNSVDMLDLAILIDNWLQ